MRESAYRSATRGRQPPAYAFFIACKKRLVSEGYTIPEKVRMTQRSDRWVSLPATNRHGISGTAEIRFSEGKWETRFWTSREVGNG